MTDLLFIQHYAPHGRIQGQEVLDAALMGSAFAQCAMLFLGDGLYQLTKSHDTSELGVKDYSVSYGVLGDYGVSQVYCRTDDLTARQLTLADLVIDVKPLSDTDIRSLMAEAKQVLTF